MDFNYIDYHSSGPSPPPMADRPAKWDERSQILSPHGNLMGLGNSLNDEDPEVLLVQVAARVKVKNLEPTRVEEVKELHHQPPTRVAVQTKQAFKGRPTKFKSKEAKDLKGTWAEDVREAMDYKLRFMNRNTGRIELPIRKPESRAEPIVKITG